MENPDDPTELRNYPGPAYVGEPIDVPLVDDLRHIGSRLRVRLMETADPTIARAHALLQRDAGVYGVFLERNGAEFSASTAVTYDEGERECGDAWVHPYQAGEPCEIEAFPPLSAADRDLLPALRALRASAHGLLREERPEWELDALRGTLELRQREAGGFYSVPWNGEEYNVRRIGSSARLNIARVLYHGDFLGGRGAVEPGVEISRIETTVRWSPGLDRYDVARVDLFADGLRVATYGADEMPVALAANTRLVLEAADEQRSDLLKADIALERLREGVASYEQHLARRNVDDARAAMNHLAWERSSDRSL